MFETRKIDCSAILWLVLTLPHLATPFARDQLGSMKALRSSAARFKRSLQLLSAASQFAFEEAGKQKKIFAVILSSRYAVKLENICRF